MSQSYWHGQVWELNGLCRKPDHFRKFLLTTLMRRLCGIDRTCALFYKSLSALECWDSVCLSDLLHHECELFKKDRFFQEQGCLFSLNHQGQAKQICLGFLMGFLLIDWGEEFRAMLDWLFGSKLRETGAWHDSRLSAEAAPDPTSSAHWWAPTSTLYSLEHMEVAAIQGINMLLVSRVTCPISGAFLFGFYSLSGGVSVLFCHLSLSLLPTTPPASSLSLSPSLPTPCPFFLLFFLPDILLFCLKNVLGQ